MCRYGGGLLMGARKGNVPWNADTSKGWTDPRGYRWIYVNELNGRGRRVARREHRVLMERHIGRLLEPWEVVHHKDGNPSNNAIDNLELMEFGKHTAEHHTGSRHSYEARKSMEIFALLREDLKRERSAKALLITALERAERAFHWIAENEPGCMGWEPPFPSTTPSVLVEAGAARDTIERATASAGGSARGGGRNRTLRTAILKAEGDGEAGGVGRG